MTDSWWCMDCLAVVSLSRHGRCERCQSEAITLSDPPRIEPFIYELEKQFFNEGKEVKR